MAGGERRRSPAGGRARRKRRRLAGPVVSSRVRRERRQETRISNGGRPAAANSVTTGACQSAKARRRRARVRSMSRDRPAWGPLLPGKEGGRKAEGGLRDLFFGLLLWVYRRLGGVDAVAVSVARLLRGAPAGDAHRAGAFRPPRLLRHHL